MQDAEIDTSAERTRAIREVTDLIIDAVHLHHLKPEQIDPDQPLTQGGLNLDSVDILEIVVAFEQKYKVKIQDGETGRQAFRSISSIADFLASQKKS